MVPRYKPGCGFASHVGTSLIVRTYSFQNADVSVLAKNLASEAYLAVLIEDSPSKFRIV